MKKLIKWFYNLKLNAKISIIYIPLSMICAAFLCIIIYRNASRPILVRINNESALIAEGILENVESTLDTIITEENRIKDKLYSADPDYQSWEIYKIYFPKELYMSCALYRESGTCPFTTNYALSTRYTTNSAAIRDFLDSPKALKYLDVYQNSAGELYIPRISRCMAEIAKSQIAYMVTFINARAWENDINKYNSRLGDSAAVLSNADGIVLQATSVLQVGESIEDRIVKTGTNHYGDIYAVDGVNYYIVSTGLSADGFMVQILVPLQTIAAQLRPVSQKTIIIMLVYTCLILLLLLTVNGMVTKPLKRMTRDLEKGGDAPYVMTDFHEKYDDEIGMLSKAFQHKSRQIEEYIVQIEEMEKKYHDAETMMFTAQMNPHLLYNTLATIIWLIQDDKKDEAMEATQSLATLLKNSLRRDREIVRVRDEVEHLRDYIKIQQLRYFDRFRHILLVNEDIMQCEMPSMVLQPLFENAIYHGIKLRESIGIIRVEGRRVGDDLLFTVSDNGPATAQELEKINASLSGGELGDMRIGTKNVHMRIRYRYGAGYGLHYEKKGELTVATVRLPAKEESDHV